MSRIVSKFSELCPGDCIHLIKFDVWAVVISPHFKFDGRIDAVLAMNGGGGIDTVCETITWEVVPQVEFLRREG
jgi:hypothetical protein